MIQVNNLTVSYNQTTRIFDRISLQIPPGTITAIVGPNGSGKSTLLKAICGLLSTSPETDIRFHGSLRESIAPQIAYLPQRESVDWDFPISVQQVVQMGASLNLPFWRWPGTAQKTKTRQALEQVGLLGYAQSPIEALSGGQQQRTFLARALAQEANYYFLDEPFAAVDAHSEQTIIDVLKSLRQSGKTVVLVHHDLQSVWDHCDHTILINRGLIAAGATHQVLTDANLRKAYGGNLLRASTTP